MNKYHFKKAFTLVELLVAMAIIAILLAISAFGIMLVQRNSRNTQRAEFLNRFKVGVERYYTNLGRYPLVERMCYNTDTDRIIMRAETSENIGAEVNLREGSFLTPVDEDSSRTASRYCYTRRDRGLYSLRYQRETNTGNDWSQEMGTSDEDCSGGASLIILNC